MDQREQLVERLRQLKPVLAQRYGELDRDGQRPDE